MKKEIVTSLDNIVDVVEYLNSNIPEDAILFLIGDLASGKTTLTANIAKFRGIKSQEVTSPTFTLQHCYGEHLYHYDLYRVDNEEFMELGLFEEFDKSGWHLIEWGDNRLKSLLIDAGYNIFSITITPYQNNRRKYEIKSH